MPDASAATVYTLESLSARVGAPDAGFAERSFEEVSEEDLVAHGVQTDSQNIIDDMPRFAGSAFEIIKGMSDAQRAALRLPKAMLPLLVAETQTLDRMKREHDASSTDAAGSKVGRESALKRTMSAAIILRRAITDALRNALPSATARVSEIVGDATTPERLATGIDAIAAFLETTMKDDGKARAKLADYDVDAATVTSLRDAATEVRNIGAAAAAPGRRVSQRALDLQDGRVLLLVERTLRAFRSARRADPTILLPELNRVAWMFESRSGSKASKGSAEPAEAPVEAAKPEPVVVD